MSLRRFQGERQCRHDLPAALQQPAKLFRVLDQHTAIAVLLGGDQPRQPEAQTGYPQHDGPEFGFRRMEAPARRVGPQHRFGTDRVELAVGLRAPVVHTDGEVIEHRTRAGVVEIDHAGQVAAFEQRVVAEQVGMQVGARQRPQTIGLRFQLGERLAQQRQMVFRQAQGHAGALLQHPIESAVAGAVQRRVAGGQVHARQPVAQFRALLCIRPLHMTTRQAGLQQRRLVGESPQGVAVAGAQGKGHCQIGAVQNIQQLDDERQLIVRAALDQCQDEFALFQADEVVAVLGAFSDALEVHQTT